MTEFYIGLAGFIMVNLLLGGVRIARGPGRADRMLAAQFLTTSSVAILLLLAEALERPSLRELALIFVALATLSTVAFVQVDRRGEDSSR